MKIWNYFVVMICILSCISLVDALEINFFEEFPTEENIDKLQYVTIETKIYLAAYNLEEFMFWQEYIQDKYPQVTEVIYWPILNKEDGYWISPWTKQHALINLFDSLNNHNKPISIMLDIEFPKKKSLILTESPKIDENYQLIKKFLEESPNNNISVKLIEMSHLDTKMLQNIGMSFSKKEYDIEIIQMYYTSFLRHFLPSFITDSLFIIKAHQAATQNNILGIGLIATGIYGNEPTYTKEILEKELDIVEDEGVQEVIIFRLGGIDEKYTYLLKKYY